MEADLERLAVGEAALRAGVRAAEAGEEAAARALLASRAAAGRTPAQRLGAAGAARLQRRGRRERPRRARRLMPSPAVERHAEAMRRIWHDGTLQEPPSAGDGGLRGSARPTRSRPSCCAGARTPDGGGCGRKIGFTNVAVMREYGVCRADLRLPLRPHADPRRVRPRRAHRSLGTAAAEDRAGDRRSSCAAARRDAATPSRCSNRSNGWRRGSSWCSAITRAGSSRRPTRSPTRASTRATPCGAPLLSRRTWHRPAGGRPRRLPDRAAANGEVAAEGGGELVLGSPLLALAHLIEVAGRSAGPSAARGRRARHDRHAHRGAARRSRGRPGRPASAGSRPRRWSCS